MQSQPQSRKAITGTNHNNQSQPTKHQSQQSTPPSTVKPASVASAPIRAMASALAASSRTLRSVMFSNAPSLKMLQFWRISTNEVPLCSWASFRTFRCSFTQTSTVRATKLASAPRATAQGSKGWSMDPMGVDLVFFPASEVGEYWPLVNP